MSHLLIGSLPVVETLAESREIVAALVADDAMVPGTPKFFDLAGIMLIATFPDGTVREAEIIADGAGRRIAVKPY